MTWVIRMRNKYYIVYVKDHYIDIANTYSSFISNIYCECTNSYFTKQMEEIFDPMVIRKMNLLDYLQQRNDYKYENGKYTLRNTITEEIIDIKIKEYVIEVEEDANKTIIFDILHNISKNFYMIML